MVFHDVNVISSDEGYYDEDILIIEDAMTDLYHLNLAMKNAMQHHELIIKDVENRMAKDKMSFLSKMQEPKDIIKKQIIERGFTYVSDLGIANYNINMKTVKITIRED